MLYMADKPLSGQGFIVYIFIITPENSMDCGRMAQVSHIKTIIMKKHIALVIPFATLCLLFAGCCKEKMQTFVGMAKVNIRVSDFSVSQEEFPSKDVQTPASYNGVGAITLAFYDGNEEVYKTTQVRNDGTYTTFGEFTADASANREN